MFAIAEDKKSIKDWLIALRENRTGAIDTKVLKVGVTASSIAAIFSKQLNEYFDKNKIDYAVFRRKDLPTLIGTKALEDKPGPPTITHWVKENLRAYGISIIHRGGFVTFKRIKPKINPQI